MIILSPAKTLNDTKDLKGAFNVKFKDKTNYILENILKFSKEELGLILKVKGKTLDKTFDYYDNFKESYSLPAIMKYEGIVFRQITNLENVLKNKYNYLKDNVFILSSFYGIVNALDSIKSYRLDFSHTKVIEENLYSFWKQEVNQYIIQKNPRQILNLASNEYYKMIDKNIKDKVNIINIKSDQKVSSTNMKKIRGELLNYCIENEIKEYIKLVGTKTNLITIYEYKENNLIFKLNEGAL